MKLLSTAAISGSVSSASKKTHRQFQDLAATNQRLRKHKVTRQVDLIDTPQVAIPVTDEDYFVSSQIVVRPEFAAFTFHLSGYALRLLNYILIHELEQRTGTFRYNALMQVRFCKYCSIFDQVPSKETIRNAIKDLARWNTILNISRGLYFLNPLISGGQNENERRDLIKAYSRELLMRGKDPNNDFYPRYNRR